MLDRDELFDQVREFLPFCGKVDKGCSLKGAATKVGRTALEIGSAILDLIEEDRQRRIRDNGREDVL